MLSRLLVATGLAAALIAGGAVAFLRTDFAANNLCAYAVATIEEATQAQVQVASCSVDPARGRLTIDGLRVGDPGGRIDLRVARVFAQVTVRPLLQRVRLERMEIDHAELKLSLDVAGSSPPKGGQCLPELLERFELGRVQIRKAAVEVWAGGVHVQVPRLNLSIRGKGEELKLASTSKGGRVELPGRTVGLISTRTSAKIDLRGAGTIEVERADLIGTEASAFISGKLSDLCDPHIETALNVRFDDLKVATDRLLPGLLEGVEGSLAADATITVDKGKPEVKGDLRLKSIALEGFSPGDLKARVELTPERIRVDRLELPVGRGTVGGAIELSLAQKHLPVTADLTLHEMELSDLLRKLGLPHAWVVLRASGRAQVKGALLPLALAAEVNFDLADFAVLDRSYQKRASAKKMFEFPKGRLTSALTIDKEKVQLKRAVLEIGSSRLDIEGPLYTEVKRGMDLLGHTESFNLDDFHGHLGPLPAHGRATFSARSHGPYQAVHIESEIAIKDLHLLDLALGDVSAVVDFQALQLRFNQIKARKGRSTYSGKVELDLAKDEIPVVAQFDLNQAYLHDLVELAVGVVPALSSLSDGRDLDGRVTGSIAVRGPVATPEGESQLQFGDLMMWGQTFAKGHAQITLHGREPRLQIEEMVLNHGDAELQISGRFGPEWQLEMDAATRRFTLADLDSAQSAHLTGPLAATSTIRGVASHPLIANQLKFTQGRAGKALLGDGVVDLLVNGKAMSWHGTVGTHSFEGRGSLLGTFPYTTNLALRVPDLKSYLDVFAPEAEIESGAVAADVAIAGSLLDWRNSEGVVSLTHLEVTRNRMAFENDGPGLLAFGPSGLEVRRLALRAPYTSATLSGSRGRDGKLDLRLAASVDGRLLQGLVPDIEHAAGTYLVQAAVGGTAQLPTVLGNLRIEDGELRLRGLTVAARELNGSISFSQDALVIDDMTAKLNNGEARLSGGIEMKSLTPKRLDMAAHISEVNFKLQDSLSATLDGDLTLFGPPLEPVLGGSLIVSRMKYSEDIDIEKGLLDFSRRPPTPKVLAKSPVLVHFDLDVHLSRGIRVENNLARADLKGDLKVTGTSRAVGLLGSVNSVHGTAQFRGNEFQIEQGVLSFTDRQRIRPSFDFQASAQVKEYKVRMHAFGTPADPHLTLVSEPALAEADLGFLLTFGFVSTNLQSANFSAADSGLALIAEGLNKVSGFSEEVRRFIPKNSILRSPNIDFASDFSATTNRLEPMLRFSSHLLNDKLDLRVLEGLTTRRYRGVVGYELSDKLSMRLQLDNEHLEVATDFGGDLHFKWEGE